MKISIFGAGYVGAVSAACLAQEGHHVVAVDPDPNKIRPLLAGESPIIEPGLPDLIRAAVTSGRLKATSDAGAAIAESELSLICVGTPSRSDGSLNTEYLKRVSEEIGAAIRTKNVFHSIVVRSTCLPGTTDEIVVPALEAASGLKAGEGFGIAYLPEFLRESTAIKDYYDPGVIVFGYRDGTTLERLQEIHEHLARPKFIVDIRTAEGIKYANNAWHAVKISFSNEMGNVLSTAGIDSHIALNILCSDDRLNISRAYLMPGFAFGGSCLPKDLRALISLSRRQGTPAPLLEATLSANEAQINRAYNMIVERGQRRIGIVGLSFKPDTDDLRESPLVELAERLYGRGYELNIYDPNIRLARLTGANASFIKARLPHLAGLLKEDIDTVISESDVIVVGNRAEMNGSIRKVAPTTPIIDLVRVEGSRRTQGNYHGICW
ncbi:GDP-mannose 6-dehydrogenase [Pseudochelatococcus lubricantis]|uniref:UDP-glucose 6-dehydrogenase n=1 Tax=Pseudochelatococcus lubricantis TaxID=1538102 RepID=A0ABX0UZZ9_9HYPH|nr:UDP-glucose/GDP-mannose dehydrogenase family protein [Pseudochelatococcus lubricantis]NIJ57869.1 GDP-mannose 6-dehydrogenase [Pseudochelatococcus lubricantis]